MKYPFSVYISEKECGLSPALSRSPLSLSLIVRYSFCFRHSRFLGSKGQYYESYQIRKKSIYVRAYPQFGQHIYSVAVDVQAGIRSRYALEQSEEDSTQRHVQRRPVAEYHYGQSQESVSCHFACRSAVSCSQSISESADSCQSSRNSNSGISHLIDVYSQRICRLRIFSAGTQPDSEFCLI